MWFSSYASAERQTDRQTYSSQYFTSLSVEGVSTSCWNAIESEISHESVGPYCTVHGPYTRPCTAQFFLSRDVGMSVVFHINFFPSKVCRTISGGGGGVDSATSAAAAAAAGAGL